MCSIKSAAILICIILISILVSGCQRADFAENQAYVVILGVDVTEDEKVSLTVKYPKLSGGNDASSGGASGETSNYVVTEAEGNVFQEALNKLHVSVSREVNLSALSLIVMSENVVERGLLNEILEQVADNYRMYSSAFVAICVGNAGEFVKAQEPQIGSRLSQGLKALIENAVKNGNIPESKMADVLYYTNSVYSDPIIMACRLKEGEKGKKIPEYSGSYIINNGLIAVRLDEYQTILANMLNGNVKQFTYVDGKNTAFISVNKRPEIKVIVDGELTAKVNINMSAMCANGDADVYEYAEKIKADIESMMLMCCNAGAEAFGLAERAAGRFSALDKWLKYNWRKEFSKCEIEVSVIMDELF